MDILRERKMLDETDTQDFTPQTVSVEIGHRVNVTEEAADFGGYTTYVVTSSDKPTRVLRSDPNRARAYVIVAGTGPVWFGTEAFCEQIFAGMPQTGQVGGAYVATGITMPITHKQELWMVPDGTHSATVTVINERWA